MRRFLILIVIAAAAWFGWRQYGGLFTKGPPHEAVIENRSDRADDGRAPRGGRHDVRAGVPPGRRDGGLPVQRHARTPRSSSPGRGTARPARWSWSGGYVPRGPMPQRHIMIVDGDGNVIYRAENK